MQSIIQWLLFTQIFKISLKIRICHKREKKKRFSLGEDLIALSYRVD